jgi:hypothetical protein
VTTSALLKILRCSSEIIKEYSAQKTTISESLLQQTIVNSTRNVVHTSNVDVVSSMVMYWNCRQPSMDTAA